MLLPSISTPNVWFFMFSIWILVASFMVLISFALWLVVFPFGMCILPSVPHNSKSISSHNVHKHSRQRSCILCWETPLLFTHFRVNMATIGEGLAYYTAPLFKWTSTPASYALS